MGSMDRFRYSVTPYTPITKLQPGVCIRKPFSADLNKDEVFLCMKHGPVYRIFNGHKQIRVTGSNFEQLHVANPGDVFTESPVDDTENVTEEPIQTEEVSQVPESEPLTAVVEDYVDETPVTEVPAEVVEEVVTEEVADDEEEDDTEDEGEVLDATEDKQSVAAPQQYNNKHNKKHKK